MADFWRCSTWLFLCLAVSTAQALMYQQTEDNLVSFSRDDLLSSLIRPAVPGSYRPSHHRTGVRKLSHFSWNTCGGSSDLFHITNLTLSPDPIKLGTPIKVTASGQITVDIDSPIEIDVQVQKKVFVWVTLPCVDDLGSCTYADLCSRLPPPPCPQPLVEANLPCSCPFPAGTYSVKDLEVEFDTTKYPAWLTEGDFKAHIVLKNSGQSIACYDVELNIAG